MTDADASRTAAEDELAKARAEAAKLVEDARRQARELLRNAQDTIDDISDDLRNIAHRKNATFNEGHVAGGVADSRRRLREAEGKLANKAAPAPVTKQTGKTPDPESLQVGTRIKYIKLDQNGEVETLPDSRGNLTIKVGAIKMKANIKELILIESEDAGNKDRNRKRYGELSFGKTKTIKTEINLIGKNLDEATDLMLKYIDDAFLAGLKSVHIIHGRGEGILRDGLRRSLKKNQHVKSFKSAPYNDGGEGCTIVELKERK